MNEPTTHTTRPSIWREIRNALKGIEVDYTQITLNRAILLLAIPMILELVMESIFAVVDIYFVGKLGPSAVSTVGLTETYMFLLYSIDIGLAMAITAIVARRIGEKETKKAGTAAAHAILIGILSSIPFMILGLFFSKELLALMGADAWALEQGYRYTQWMLGGNIVIVLIFVINAIFRGAGDAAVAMRVLIIANTINIFLDPALINGWGPLPALGVEGAAIATNIGRGVGVLVQLWFLFRGGKKIKISLEQFRLKTEVLWNIIKTSLGGIGQMIISMTSWIFLVRILSDISVEAVAGSTIVVRLLMFTLMPAWGLSNAAATLVGQYLGAEKPDQAESAVWKIGIYNMFFLILVSICFFFFNTELMGIFSDDPEVIRIGAEWIRILSYSYCIYGWWMVSVQAFNGAGDTKTPTWINVIFFWIIQIPLAYLLALHWQWEYSGVFWAVFISETTLGLCTLLLFKRGKWKTMKV